MKYQTVIIESTNILFTIGKNGSMWMFDKRKEVYLFSFFFFIPI